MIDTSDFLTRGNDDVQAALDALDEINLMLMGRTEPKHIFYIETIKRALAQQQPDAAWLLVALDRVEAVICHEVCSSTNKKISDSGELCRSDISKIRSFLLRPVDLKELKKKEYHNLKVKAFLEQEEDDGQTKRAEQKGGE